MRTEKPTAKRMATRMNVVLFLALSAHAETIWVIEDFSKDPGWEGRNNQRTRRGGRGAEKRQDFGHTTTNFAGGFAAANRARSGDGSGVRYNPRGTPCQLSPKP